MSISYQTLSSNQIHLNSSQAIAYNNGTYKSDVNFYLKDSVKIDKNTIEMKLSVVNAQIPYSFYQINNTNNVFQVKVNGITTSYNLSIGNYNINTFITMLSSLLGGNWNINYNTTTNLITFINSSYNFTFSDGTNSCFSILGFQKGTIYNSSSKILVSSFPFNLNPYNVLFINTFSLPLQNSDSYNKGSNNSLAIIPVNCIPNDVIFYNNTTNFKNDFKNPESILNLNISINDIYENYINFNNLDWDITIQIDYVKEFVIFKDKNLEDIIKKELEDINR
jgi:hypothetical protein